ncbi:MAG: NADH:ubiquinone reductase (Na(+)-transporting) subunit C [Saprospiraceae bacterium]
MNKSSYIIGFVTVLTAVVALVLSLLYSGLKDTHKKNELLFEKKAILSSLKDVVGNSKLTNDEVSQIFSKDVSQYIIDTKGNILDKTQLENLGLGDLTADELDAKKEFAKPFDKRLMPLYVYKDKKGDEYYVVKLLGKGLWDEISGYLALDGDKNTIHGASFDHKGETPGMGAEMKDNPKFAAEFKGKAIFDDKGNLVSIDVRKGGAVDKMHDVDGITGATLTSDGITRMLKTSLTNYEAFLEKQ